MNRHRFRRMNYSLYFVEAQNCPISIIASLVRSAEPSIFAKASMSLTNSGSAGFSPNIPPYRQKKMAALQNPKIRLYRCELFDQPEGNRIPVIFALA